MVSDMVTRQNGLSTVFLIFFARTGDFGKKIGSPESVPAAGRGKSSVF
jgi:hypothetical protein